MYAHFIQEQKHQAFLDRQDAGRRLAAKLHSCALELPIVLGLPRGGVPVAYEIARALEAPLDVWIARKVGVPSQPELGLGAVAEGGFVQLNEEILDHVALPERQLAELVKREQREVLEQAGRLRGHRPPPDLHDRTVILVDDGVATGATVRAAIRSIRAQSPKAIVLAVPVAAPATLQALASEVDRVVCVRVPPDFGAVGSWYIDFDQVSDDEVVHLLALARRL